MTTKRIGLARTRRAYTQGATRPATASEAHLGLALKLHEEVAEVVRAPRDVFEYADVLQALMDYAELNGVSWRDVLDAMAMKSNQDGPFLPALLWEARS